jgi:hypothetical protein
MPSHALHRYFAKKLLGNEYNSVNRIMDLGAYLQPGKSHRKGIEHNPLFVLMMTGDQEKFKAAILHQILDNTITTKQGEMLEAILGIKKDETGHEIKRKKR